MPRVFYKVDNVLIPEENFHQYYRDSNPFIYWLIDELNNEQDPSMVGLLQNLLFQVETKNYTELENAFKAIKFLYTTEEYDLMQTSPKFTLLSRDDKETFDNELDQT